MMLKRTIFDTILQISSAWSDLRLTGPRQVGKSSVLDMLKEVGRKICFPGRPIRPRFGTQRPAGFFTETQPADHHRRSSIRPEFVHVDQNMGGRASAGIQTRRQNIR